MGTNDTMREVLVHEPAAIVAFLTLASAAMHTLNPMVTVPKNDSWHEEDPMGPIFFDLATSAEELVKDGRKFYSTVDHVIRAYSRVEGGFFYNITYAAKKTLCPVTTYFHATPCLPHKNWAEMRECNVIIWEAADKAHRKLIHYKCGAWTQVDYAIPE